MEMDDKEKRVAESPVSVSAASDISSSSRPNKRKRKGTAPTRHVQQVNAFARRRNFSDTWRAAFGTLTHPNDFLRFFTQNFSLMGSKKRIIQRQIRQKKMQTR